MSKPKNEGKKNKKGGPTGKVDGASYRVRADAKQPDTIGYGDKVTSRVIVVEGKVVTVKSVTTIRTRSGEIPIPDAATQQKLLDTPPDSDTPSFLDVLDPVDGAIALNGLSEIDDRGARFLTLQHSAARIPSPPSEKGSRKPPGSKGRPGAKSRS